MTYSMFQERVLLYRTLLSSLPLPIPLLRGRVNGFDFRTKLVQMHPL